MLGVTSDTIKATSGQTCPICGNDSFEQFKNRPNDTCTKCRSLGRARMIYMTLKRFGMLRSGLSAIHFAPEIGLASALYDVYGENYFVADIASTRFKNLPGGKPLIVDLCHLSPDFLASRYDVIIHSHVLEHVPCQWTLALMQLHSTLRHGGLHVFCIPIISDYGREDLRRDMSEADRCTCFGQRDHMRAFGRKDFVDEMQKLADLTRSRFIIAHEQFSGTEKSQYGLSGTVFAMFASAA